MGRCMGNAHENFNMLFVVSPDSSVSDVDTMVLHIGVSLVDGMWAGYYCIGLLGV
jgi:hypothetical protein